MSCRSASVRAVVSRAAAGAATSGRPNLASYCRNSLAGSGGLTPPRGAPDPRQCGLQQLPRHPRPDKISRAFDCRLAVLRCPGSDALRANTAHLDVSNNPRSNADGVPSPELPARTTPGPFGTLLRMVRILAHGVPGYPPHA